MITDTTTVDTMKPNAGDARRAIARAVLRAHVTSEYVRLVGYDPFKEDPATTVEDALLLLEEYKAELARARVDAAARPDVWIIGDPDWTSYN